MYGSIEQSDIYSHNIESEDSDKKKFAGTNTAMTLRKVNQSDLMEK